MGKVVRARNVDTERLDAAIKKSGLRPGYIVEQLGITRQGFDYKRKGKTTFRQSEVYVLCDLLGLTDQEKIEIFFPERLVNEITNFNGEENG